MDDKDWNSVPNDPPIPSKVSPLADLGACTRTLQFRVKASDTAHKAQTAAEYWVKAPGETEFTNKGYVFFGNITIPANDNLTGIEYKWRVKARDEKWLESGLTGFSNFKILPDNQAPSAPGGLDSPRQTTTSVDLAWSASADNCGLGKYVLTRTKLFPPPLLSPDPSSEITIDLPATVTSYTDRQVQSGSYYEYKIKSQDIYTNYSGNSSPLRVFVPLI